MSGQKDLRKNVKKCFIGGGISAFGAIVGGLVGGPIGMGVGGAVGSVISAAVLRVRSVPDVMNDFTPNERTDLLERTRRAAAIAKDSLIDLLMRILREIPKCSSKGDFLERILLPILGELTVQGLIELFRYIFSSA